MGERKGGDGNSFQNGEEGNMKRNKSEKRFLISFIGVFLFLTIVPYSGHAAIPPTINYQGYLTSAAGVPVNGTVQMVFRIYNVESGGTDLWSEAHNVTLSQGVYNVVLGASSLLPNPIALPFDQQYYLGVKVGTDPEMTPRIPLTSVGYAFRAQTVESVGSHTHNGADITTGTVLEPRIDSAVARTSALTAHASNTNNPHSTTAAQVGAAPTVHAHSGSDITTGIVAEARIDPLIARDSEVSAAIASHNHDDRYYIKAYVDALEARIAALEAKLSGFTRSGNDIIITGANLHIRSGSGTTNGTVNGNGNLIIGYNESRGPGDVRTGSHNLIVGRAHNYSSYGGIVAGIENTISGAYSSVSGGALNTASGSTSSVTGGYNNTASGSTSSVSGGYGNTATVGYSSVSGGRNNIANNTYASVSGGYANNASGGYSSVSGGAYNTVTGAYASVSGGRNNIASGDYSSVAGGGSDNASLGNKAFGNYTAILGGFNNKSGDPALADHAIGQYSTVSGGQYNTASGAYSSVSGGAYNTASSGSSSVSGGGSNNASGDRSSVSGGTNNTASYFYSSVSGGYANDASGYYSSVSGGYANTSSGETSSVSGGANNTASGDDSSVSGGHSRSATAVYDWAAGGLWQND